MNKSKNRTKICTKCEKKKPLVYFHKTSRKYKGKVYEYRHAKCAECRNKERRDSFKSQS